MFRCYFCHEVTPPKTKRHSVVISVREKTYPSRRKDSKRPQGRFRPRQEADQDVGGKGTETAQEVSACPSCAAKQQNQTVVPAAAPVAPVEDTQE